MLDCQPPPIETELIVAATRRARAHLRFGSVQFSLTRANRRGRRDSSIVAQEHRRRIEMGKRQERNQKKKKKKKKWKANQLRRQLKSYFSLSSISIADLPFYFKQNPQAKQTRRPDTSASGCFLCAVAMARQTGGQTGKLCARWPLSLSLSLSRSLWFIHESATNE